MKDTSRISIALAVHNGERFLGEQLESFLRQERLPDELIISDNASTDRTREIVREFAAAAPFTVHLLVNQSNGGIMRNFHRALKECTGDIICLSDCDDVWLPAKLRRVEEVFAVEPSVGIILSNSEFVDSTLRPLGLTTHRRRFAAYGSHEVMHSGREALAGVLAERPAPYGHAMAFRSVVLTYPVVPLPDASFGREGGHDRWLAYMLALFVDLAVIGEPLVLYRRHSEQSANVGRKTLAPLTLGERIRRLLDSCDPGSLATLCSLVDLVRERLSQFGYNDRDVLSVFDDYSRFYGSRAQFPPLAKHLRIRPILAELGRGSYRRFANGVASAAKDLLASRVPPMPSAASFGVDGGEA